MGKDGEEYEFQLELYQKDDTQDGYSVAGKSITTKIDEPTKRAVTKVQGKLSDGIFYFYELRREMGSSLCAKGGALELTSPEGLSGGWYGSETDYDCGSGTLKMNRIKR